jgi:ammonia channel protein AmtB
MGALVMWLAAGFSMLEAGMVRAKNSRNILYCVFLLFKPPLPINVPLPYTVHFCMITIIPANFLSTKKNQQKLTI